MPTHDELYAKILEIIPGATTGQDNYGQLIIYTDMRLTDNDELVPFEDPNEEEPVAKLYAVKLSPEVMDKVTAANGGVRPHLYRSTYFITTDDARGHNQILGAKSFFAKYEFIEPEQASDFTEIREKG